MKYANGVKATTLTTGTGDVTLAEVSGYVPFPLAFSVGDTIPYAIRNGQNWEWGVGTVQAGGVLERTEVVSTLVAGVFTVVAPARITLTGVSEVVCAITAEDYKALNDSLLAHTTDVANPHGVTAAQANADPVGTAAGLVAAHEIAPDPHSVYPLEADLGTAAFLDVGTAVGDVVQVQAGGKLPALDASDLLNLPASGVTDHGALTGLADDDHGQYHTDARGDARYAPIAKGVTNGDSHDHSGGGGAQIAYASLSGTPTLGTAAAAATGDFEAAGTVSTHNAVTTAHGISVWGATLVDDANQATARATLGLGTAATTSSTAYESAGAVSAHAGGTSVHAIASVTGLQGALDAKAPTASPTFTGTVGGITAAMVGAPSGSGNSTGTNTGNETTTTIGALLNSATSKTTPVDADQIGVMDSAAANILKKLSWANLKTTLLGGSPITDFFKHGSVVMNANSFGGRKLFINSINNALFRAEARWVVTGNLFATADDSLVGSISAESLAKLFDGSYDTYLDVPVGNYAVVNINFSTESGGTYPGYPYGYLYMSHYYDRYSSSTRTSTLSVYCNYAPQGIGWHTTSLGEFFSGANQKIDSARQSRYAISQFELKIYAPDSGASAQITQLDFNPDRPGTNEVPVVDKFKPNKLYSTLSTQTLLPRVAGIYDLGSSALPYKSAYIRGTLRVEFSAGVFFDISCDASGRVWIPAPSIHSGPIEIVASSSTTAAQTQCGYRGGWLDSTHATRKGFGELVAADYAGQRVGLRVEADGTQIKTSVNGVPAAARAAALTAEIPGDATRDELRLTELYNACKNFGIIN